MPFQPPRPLSVLASALAVVGLLAVAGCSSIAPLGPDPAPANLPPPRNLGSPITMQVMRSESPTPANECPAGSIALFGSDPTVPLQRTVQQVIGAPGPLHSQIARGSTATPVPPPTPMATPTAPLTASAGMACFVPVGRRVTITSAAVSSVTTNRNQPGPAWYVFVVGFPAADVPALTSLIHQAYASGDALGVTVAGKLWQAPQPRHKFAALRAEQINLLSRTQALQLYRLLVRSG
jgi:hypothetical protein